MILTRVDESYSVLRIKYAIWYYISLEFLYDVPSECPVWVMMGYINYGIRHAREIPILQSIPLVVSCRIRIAPRIVIDQKRERIGFQLNSDQF